VCAPSLLLLPPCRILFSLLFALIGAGLLSIFWHSRVVDIAISGIGAAVFACYIVFDVQV
jgi:FtsH-binding integral membrane protein